MEEEGSSQVTDLREELQQSCEDYIVRKTQVDSRSLLSPVISLISASLSCFTFKMGIIVFTS